MVAIQTRIESPLPTSADGKAQGFTGNRLAELVTAKDPLEVLTASSNLTEILRLLEARFAVYSATEVFIVHRYRPGVAVADAPRFDEPHSLFTEWASVTLENVLDWCTALIRFCPPGPRRTSLIQDLTWTYAGVLAAIIDPALRTLVLDSIQNLHGVPFSASGPVALWILLNHLTACTPHVLNEIKQRILYNFKLSDVPGSNVVSYNRLIFETLAFLRSRGETITDAAYRVLHAYKAGPMAFSLYFSTMETTEHVMCTDVNQLMAAGVRKYESMLSHSEWGLATKSGASFFAREDSTPVDSITPAAHSVTPATDKNGKKTHDAKGNPIDRTPPAPGTSLVRLNPLTQKNESWCGNTNCLRWGNHTEETHDAWYKKLQDRNKARAAKKAAAAAGATPATPATPADAATPAPATTPPATNPPPADDLTMTRGSLNYASAATLGGSNF